MRLLLDTHILVWLLAGNSKLSDTARRAIMEADQVYISAASFWEIAIKASGKGFDDFDLSSNWHREFRDQCQSWGVDWLGIEPEHCKLVEELPFYHRDPFDRMLIAQAMVEGLAMVSTDQAFHAYDLELLS